jgi:hypothetical protein
MSTVNVSPEPNATAVSEPSPPSARKSSPRRVPRNHKKASIAARKRKNAMNCFVRLPESA